MSGRPKRSARPDVPLLDGAATTTDEEDSSENDDDFDPEEQGSDATPEFLGEDDDSEEEVAVPAPQTPVPQPQRATDDVVDSAPAIWNVPRRDPGPLEGCPLVDRDRKLLRPNVDVLGLAPYTAVGLFSQFFQEALCERIVRCTNLRLRRKGMTSMTQAELQIWLALLITMGIKRLPSTKMYWRRDTFGNVM